MKQILTAIALTFMVSGVQAENRRPPDLVVALVESSGDPIVYVDGKLEPKGRFYDVFAKYHRMPGGKERAVSLFVSDRLPFYYADAVLGEIQAVGFRNTNVYEFNRKSRTAVQIIIKGPPSALPFTRP